VGWIKSLDRPPLVDGVKRVHVNWIPRGKEPKPCRCTTIPGRGAARKSVTAGSQGTEVGVLAVATD
jgi:hypothetical protein